MTHTQELMKRFKEVHLEKVPREKNEGADALAKASSRRDTKLLGTIEFCVQEKPSVSEAQKVTRFRGDLMEVEDEVVDTWMTPILKFIQEGQLPESVKEARSLRYKAARFVIYDGVLYKRGFNQPLLKCIAASLTPLLSPWPFALWGIDLIGELPKAKGGVRFGIPYKLISDNGKQFDSKELKKFCDYLNIRINFAAVYHPQSNGQTEAINKIIKHTLKAKLEEKKAMVPVEVGAGSFRRDHFQEEDNVVNQRLHLDMLEEVRRESQVRLAAYQQSTARFYNSRVKPRPFKVGDLVLRKMMPGMKVPGHGVFGANWEGPYCVRAEIFGGAYYLEDMQGEPISKAWNAEHLKKYYQ
nr:PREDICTED: uncharacterized protein LOC108198103 [Daucus carota subsp. sativus]